MDETLTVRERVALCPPVARPSPHSLAPRALKRPTVTTQASTKSLHLLLEGQQPKVFCKKYISVRLQQSRAHPHTLPPSLPPSLPLPLTTFFLSWFALTRPSLSRAPSLPPSSPPPHLSLSLSLSLGASWFSFLRNHGATLLLFASPSQVEWSRCVDLDHLSRLHMRGDHDHLLTPARVNRTASESARTRVERRVCVCVCVCVCACVCVVTRPVDGLACGGQGHPLEELGPGT